MLEWLSPDFSDAEKHYFLNRFVPCKIEQKQDIKGLKQFADLLISHNTQGNYDTSALRNKFKSHIAYGALAYAEEHYFAEGYNPIRFFHLLTSGLYSTLLVKNRHKILVKCLLLKKTRIREFEN